MTSSLSNLKCDTFRVFGCFGLFKLIKGFFLYRTFRPIVTLRLCQFFNSGNLFFRSVLPLFIVLHRFCTGLAGIDLSWRTHINGGFIFTHGWGAVINEMAVIGRNVTIFHGVTIGRLDKINSLGDRVTAYPIIEDDVWIGPHSIIVGGVRIGKGSRIAGGAFVNFDVPAYSVVSGNPGVITKSNCIPDVYNRVPLDQY
ncbi:serine acetyltransferase [Deefgea piscis]|uniref:Serine acetyltransferase n=1 Tax=Deefgea piscis TaxID=2739061 RepID=A0A6M8STS7_9NEIS|nr:serine acetyltransferase [Deefgea piscis]QKJ66856.1 serine acetyltransferase [Deefgea piscis]